MAKKQGSNPKGAMLFGSFEPLETLWSGDAENPTFPSESSARWFIRTHRDALVKAEAIAIHAGRMMVDLQKVAAVAKAVAIQAAAKAGQ